MSPRAEPYPGETATAAQVLRLAEEYRKAAEILLEREGRHEPLSTAPCRLLAIHSIELHLSAWLLHVGHEPSWVRGLQHDLSERTELAIASGILFRKKTAAHLKAMTGNREYLVTRYGPEMTATISQINRLTATLAEVAHKVNDAMKVPHPPEPSPTAHIAKSIEGHASVA